VYLHATPAQSLFARSRRDFSHGCIRVEEPHKLAEWVFRNNPGWTNEKIEAAFAAQKNEQVNLAKTIPVLVLYATASVSDDGVVHFFNDIYGFDKNLDALCCEAYLPRR
ncbi:MAG TPA: L,D-transpeptidase family protein, partial [Bryobacteraceae bacterium]|nr:L,D-transpeptidase family protein [Bryobacteraceae bacterium]